jgi:hypothetical protein
MWARTVVASLEVTGVPTDQTRDSKAKYYGLPCPRVQGLPHTLSCCRDRSGLGVLLVHRASRMCLLTMIQEGQEKGSGESMPHQKYRSATHTGTDVRSLASCRSRMGSSVEVDITSG